MASASNAKPEPPRDFGPEWETRQAAARGEKTSISLLGWVRLWTRTLALALGLLLIVPCHYIYRVISYGSPFPKWFLAYATWVVGARVQRHGTPLRRDVFFIANHVSWVDILALAGASGTAFVAKAELASSPLVGWLAGLNRTVFVQRED
ncbi:MAG: lysophospholipid acyltransferase family protein, partial [Alteriqipengyuania sp.]